MEVQISDTQRKRNEKIERLRGYFKGDTPSVFATRLGDDALDFTAMSDSDVAEYLKVTRQ